MTPRHLQLATAVLKTLEACFLHAYPDPASPMGKALGQRGINQVGKTGVVPAKFAHLDGNPWTIGHGETRGVKKGDHWTQAEADRRLEQAVVDFDRRACATWPGADQLRPKARAALVVLAYNRGLSLKRTDRRKEMIELGSAIATKSYAKMAYLVRSMKRLWVGQGLNGLIARREMEAQLIEDTTP